MLHGPTNRNHEGLVFSSPSQLTNFAMTHEILSWREGQNLNAVILESLYQVWERKVQDGRQATRVDKQGLNLHKTLIYGHTIHPIN